MKKLILYTKDGCSLCDKVKDKLADLAGEFPHQLEEVDITKDEVLFEKYRFSIPVLQSEEDVIQAPIALIDLRNLLAK